MFKNTIYRRGKDEIFNIFKQCEMYGVANKSYSRNFIFLLYEAPAWAKEEIIENKTYYFVSRNLILDELPMFFEKSDTVYRNLKALQEKGLIEYIKQGKKDLIRITAKGKTWNEFKENNSEKNPSFEENSEKNPNNLGKNPKRVKNSEKIRQIIILYIIIIILIY
ncbi:hypothetical protein JMUB3936_p2040 (plasmid) [Leptotrichia wadei]|uniref:Uncharacterized protein n=1 Tax=Leptotrichia wadei TaxID=157687 RepID=A0A510KWI9_9FUSO|nr:hypothetical protein JMUB3936_p2040 [Leptotrichia wadei]